MKHCIAAFTLILIAVAGRVSVVAKDSADPLAIVVATRIAPEPAEVLVRMRVEPDARSRELTVEWWALEGFGGSHLITLEGDRAALWHNYRIKGMEAGEYEVSAVLKRNDGTELRRKLTVTIIGVSGASSSSSPFSASR